jgi:hypothetical protein
VLRTTPTHKLPQKNTSANLSLRAPFSTALYVHALPTTTGDVLWPVVAYAAVAPKRLHLPTPDTRRPLADHQRRRTSKVVPNGGIQRDGLMPTDPSA